MTLAASRPAAALRSAAVVAVVAAVARIPAIATHFAAALAAAHAGEAANSDRVVYGSAVPAPQTMAAATAATSGANVQLATAVVPRTTPTYRRGLSRTQVADDRPATGADAGADAAASIDAAADPPFAAIAAGPAIAVPRALAFDLATNAYTRLAAGDRRAAVRLFDAALAGADGGGDDAWRRQRNALTRRWSASAYSLVRANTAGAIAATPVLGASQSGAALTFTPDPLSPRPVAITLRAGAAHGDGGRSSFAAVGVSWRPVAGVTLAAERLVPVGSAAHGDWLIRAAAGEECRFGRVRLTGYGEAGLIGSAAYAAIEARAGAVWPRGRVEVAPSAGVWASAQTAAGHTIHRLDVGPGIVVRSAPLTVAVDYRFRLAGNAAPASGPVATVSVNF